MSKNIALPTPCSISTPAPYRARVSFDWDGVHGNFDGWCLKLFGAGSRDLTYRLDDGTILKGDPALWAHVDRTPEFWTEMPMMEGSEELMEVARPYGVQFLTGCPRQGYDRAEREKRLHIDRRFPGVHVVTCLSKNKALHMQEPGDWIVDDFIANIRRREKAGGQAVYYKNHRQAIRDLKEGLTRHFGEM
jgi:hypothetical protein